jgi:hypothetical protein
MTLAGGLLFCDCSLTSQTKSRILNTGLWANVIALCSSPWTGETVPGLPKVEPSSLGYCLSLLPSAGFYTQAIEDQRRRGTVLTHGGSGPRWRPTQKGQRGFLPLGHFSWETLSNEAQASCDKFSEQEKIKKKWSWRQQAEDPGWLVTAISLENSVWQTHYPLVSLFAFILN